MPPKGSLRRAVAVLAALCCLGGAAAAPAGLAPSDALSVEAVVPVLRHDLSQAHQQALAAGFRQAIAASLTAGGLQGQTPDRFERYILAYRVREQSQRDLFYRLRLEVWVDRKLLRAETRPGGSAR